MYIYIYYPFFNFFRHKIFSICALVLSLTALFGAYDVLLLFRKSVAAVRAHYCKAKCSPYRRGFV